MTGERSALFRHRDRPRDPWLTGRGWGAVREAGPAALLQTSGAQIFPLGPTRPPCHPCAAFVPFCAQAGGKSLGKSQGGSPLRHLWPKALEVRDSPFVTCGTKRLIPKSCQSGWTCCAQIWSAAPRGAARCSGPGLHGASQREGAASFGS